MKRLLIALGVFAAVAAAVAFGALLAGRALFAEPGVREIGSVTEDLQAQRILLVFAHPDDEILATELIRRAAREGAYVSLFTATRGEAGTQAPPVADQRHLGVVRAAEVYRHGFALGVTDQTVLNLGDGLLAGHPPELLVSIVADEIMRSQPDLVVTFHPDSAISLHPDHMAIGMAARAAARRAAAEGADIRLAYVLAPRPGLRNFGGETQDRIADLQPPPDVAIRAEAGIKRRAWRIHASQADYIPATTGLPAWLLYALWTHEYYALEDAAGAGG
ncbi:MAG: PIG-L family deacetylase [Maricaulaceae bacterium]|nr:PIG-L family deacetylase [Maricaulaceae bacterium]